MVEDRHCIRPAAGTRNISSPAKSCHGFIRMIPFSQISRVAACYSRTSSGLEIECVKLWGKGGRKVVYRGWPDRGCEFWMAR